MSETTVRSTGKGASLLKLLPLTVLLAACGPNYSPNTYSSAAVQQANKVDSGVVVGVRKVTISVDSTVASATGAAAGGIGGSQVAEGAVSALGALGGAVVGGIAGNEVGHKVQDTYGYEYIVRKANGDLLSVTQKDTVPLAVGQRVLLIQGTQARIVSDYTVPVDTDLAAPPNKPQSPNEPKPDLSKPAPPETPPAETPPAEEKPAPAEATTPETSVAPEAAEPAGPETAPAASETTAAPATPSATTPPEATPEASTTNGTNGTSEPAAKDIETPDATKSEATEPAAAPVTHGPGSAH
jgi:outer membrane lipoprotein SlyB